MVIGNLMQMMVLLKALPSTYNRDLQEDKKILFDAVGETARSISIFSSFMEKISFNKDKIRKKLESGFPEATDMADYLVKKGESFRKSHQITRNIVHHCIENKKMIKDIGLDKLKKFSSLFEKDIYQHISLESCLEARKVDCGTSKKSINKRIKQVQKLIESYTAKLETLRKRTADFDSIINSIT